MTAYYLPSTVSSGNIVTIRSLSLRITLKMFSSFMKTEISKSFVKRIFSFLPLSHTNTAHNSNTVSPSQSHQSTTHLTLSFSPSATTIHHRIYKLFLPLSHKNPPQNLQSVSPPQPHIVFLPFSLINPQNALQSLPPLSKNNPPHTLHSVSPLQSQ
jgi:hypothetical protein